MKKLNITEFEYKLSKLIHIFSSFIVPALLSPLLKNFRASHYELLAFLLFTLALVGSYCALAYIINAVWGQIDRTRPRYY